MSNLPAYPRHVLSAFLASLLMIFSCASVILAQDESNQSEDPVKLFNQGQDAHEKGDFQTAIKFYEQALKISPEFPEAEYQKGTAFVSLGNHEQAEKSFRRAAQLREDWSLPLTSLASLLIERNKFSEAETVLTKVVEIDELNSAALMALTELKLRSNATPEVLKGILAKIENASQNGKPDAALFAARGAIENALGDKTSARKNLNNALSIEPNNVFALSARTEISLSENNFQAATEDAKTLVKLMPNSANAKLRLARIYAASGNSSEASSILQKLDSSNPEVASLKNSIATNMTEDVSVLEKQVAQDSKNALILGRLCGLMRSSNPQKALDYCRRASEIEPNNINHATGFGAALVQARQFDPAIALFRRLLQISPDNYIAHANLATALFELKRYNEAKTEYLWLVGNKPDLAIGYYFLAISHDQMGEYFEARENYRKFLQFADSKQNQLEIDKVNLRLPALDKLVKQKGRKQ